MDVELAPSPIAGRGLFATADLPAGAVVPPRWHERINHSCDPNLGWRPDGSLETLRELAAGEELVVDYAMGTADPTYLLRCHCGSPRCRQMVEGTDWRIPQLRQRYAGHWAPPVQQLLDDDTE